MDLKEKFNRFCYLLARIEHDEVWGRSAILGFTVEQRVSYQTELKDGILDIVIQVGKEKHVSLYRTLALECAGTVFTEKDLKEVSVTTWHEGFKVEKKIYHPNIVDIMGDPPKRITKSRR